MNFSLPYFVGKKVVYVGSSQERASFEKFITGLIHIKSFTAVDKKTSPSYIEDLKDLDDDNDEVEIHDVN